MTKVLTLISSAKDWTNCKLIPQIHKNTPSFRKYFGQTSTLQWQLVLQKCSLFTSNWLFTNLLDVITLQKPVEFFCFAFFHSNQVFSVLCSLCSHYKLCWVAIYIWALTNDRSNDLNGDKSLRSTIDVMSITLHCCTQNCNSIASMLYGKLDTFDNKMYICQIPFTSK